jgi:chemotaxis response regulator CheB
MTRRVLVVDDDADLRMLLRIALNVPGASEVVGEAADGQLAVSAAADLRPDVVVLDEAMPVLRGTEAIPLLRRATPSSRIVLYSAWAQTEQRARFEELADAVVAKGRDLSELAALVATL